MTQRRHRATPNDFLKPHCKINLFLKAVPVVRSRVDLAPAKILDGSGGRRIARGKPVSCPANDSSALEAARLLRCATALANEVGVPVGAPHHVTGGVPAATRQSGVRRLQGGVYRLGLLLIGLHNRSAEYMSKHARALNRRQISEPVC